MVRPDRKSEYLTRANAQALDCRADYLEAGSYGTSAHWSMMKEVALHYLATGDYNHVRPHSAHGGLTLDAVSLTPRPAGP